MTDEEVDPAWRMEFRHTAIEEAHRVRAVMDADTWGCEEEVVSVTADVQAARRAAKSMDRIDPEVDIPTSVQNARLTAEQMRRASVRYPGCVHRVCVELDSGWRCVACGDEALTLDQATLPRTVVAGTSPAKRASRGQRERASYARDKAAARACGQSKRAAKRQAMAMRAERFAARPQKNSQQLLSSQSAMKFGR